MEFDFEQFLDIARMNNFILAQGYEITWGDSYFQIDKGEWFFQSTILAECQLEALKHCGVSNFDTLRWIAQANKVVTTFKGFNFSLDEDLVTMINDETNKLLNYFADLSNDEPSDE